MATLYEPPGSVDWSGAQTQPNRAAPLPQGWFPPSDVRLHASQGAGGQPGWANLGPAVSQQQQAMQYGQRQAGLAQAAFMRNTPTPGSNASMQWLQRQGSQGGGSPGQGQGMQWLQQQQPPRGFGQPMGQGQPMGGGWGMR